MKAKIAVIPGDGIGVEVTAEAQKVLAAVAEARGDYEAALGHFKRALKSGQPAGEPALRGGRLAQAGGDLNQARFFFQEADRTDPESCWAAMARRALEGMNTPSPEPR